MWGALHSGGTEPVDDFARRFADYIGVRYALACPNGTSALTEALLDLGYDNATVVGRLVTTDRPTIRVF